MIYEAELEKYRQTVAPKSRNKQTAEFRHYLKWLSPKKPSKANLLKYIEHLQVRYEDGTIRQKLMVVKKGHVVNGWEWPLLRGEAPVVREKHVHRPIMASIRLDQMMNVVLGMAPVEGNVLPDARHKCYLAAATIWGMRRIELAEMKSSWLDLKNKTIFIQTAKSGRQRYHLVPDFAIPLLEEWHFERQVSESYLDKIMKQLKIMVGFSGAPAYGASWHSLRRACIQTAKNAGFHPYDVHNFYRWKVDTKTMALRYTSGTIVGDEENVAAIPVDDLELDQRMYEEHPFCVMWKERLAKVSNA